MIVKFIILPPTTKRVAARTCSKINETIRNRTIRNIDTHNSFAGANLSDKLKKLDNEWDTERLLETNAATMMILCSILGYKSKNRSCFFLTGTVGFCLLQHALLGWCPSLPLIRELGVRTAEEINQEKTVYKYIRGDFERLTRVADEMIEIAEK